MEPKNKILLAAETLSLFILLQCGELSAASIGKVNGKELSPAMFQRLYQAYVNQYRLIFKENFAESMLESLQKRVLEELIREKILLDEATRLGIEVSDEEVIEEIEEEINTLPPTFLKLRKKEVRVNLKIQKLTTQIRNRIKNTLTVTDLEAKNYYYETTMEPKEEDFERHKEALKETLRAQKTIQEYENWYNSLKQRATIELNPDFKKLFKGNSSYFPPRRKLLLEAEAKEEVWVQIIKDSNEEEREEIFFRPGEHARWEADEKIKITVGNAGGLNLRLNGQELPSLGKRGEVVTRIITAEGVEMSPSAWMVGEESLPKLTDKVGDEIWVKIGLKDAGTIWDLVRDPNNPEIVYVATERKGILKSTNNGLDWVAINKGLEDLLIRCLAIDETNPSILYAGSKSRGIFKSSDGGLIWVSINNGISILPTGIFPAVQSIRIDPSNAQVIYLATNKGLYKTTTGGANWILVRGLPSSDVRCIALDSKSLQTVYAGLGYGGLCRSIDGGSTWKVLFGTNLVDDIANAILSIAIDPVSSNVIYIGRGSGGIFKTTDGGSIWLPINNGFPPSLMVGGQPLSICSIKVDPTNSMVLYATTYGGGVYISRDGGTSWSEYTYGLARPGISGAQVISIDRSGRVLAGGRGGIFEIGRIKEKKTISCVNFEFDSDRIKPEVYPVLDSIANKLKENPLIRAIIEGYTDNIGSEEYNLDLSKRRARSVEEYLIEKGIMSTRLSSFGYGKSRPMTSNETEEGRYKNRRVEILLIGAK